MNLEVEEFLCIGFYFLFEIGSVLVVWKRLEPVVVMMSEWVRIDYSDKAWNHCSGSGREN